MRGKRLLQFFVPLLCLFVLFFLLATAPGEGESGEELSAISVIWREDTPVLSTLRSGMEQAAADLGAELRFLAPEKANDPGEQEALLRREVEGGAEGLILMPADRGALQEAVSETRAVVVTLETGLEDTAGCIGVDNEALGEALGKLALNGVPQGGTALLIASVPGDNAISERLEAARSVLEAEGRRVALAVPTSKKPLEKALPEYLARTKAAALVAFEPSALELGAEVVRDIRSDAHAVRRYPPLLYGFGSSPAIAAGLEQSHVTAIQAQNDFTAGYLAVLRCIQGIRHLPGEGEVELPFLSVRRENMYEQERQKLLFPMIH